MGICLQFNSEGFIKNSEMGNVEILVLLLKINSFFMNKFFNLIGDYVDL